MAMWKQILLVVIAVGGVGMFSGCSANNTAQAQSTLNREEISDEQLIEIASYDNVVIRQITDVDSIIEYVQNMDISQWELIECIPEQSELLYTFTSYEKVTDEFWLEHGAPEISVIRDALYQNDDNFYIESSNLNDNYAVLYEIPVSEGEYLTDLAKSSSEIKDKNDIFDEWGINNFDISIAESNINNTKTDMADEIINNNIEYSAEDIKKVSSEQKIEIAFSDTETKYTSTDLDTIADFYNNIERHNWIDVSDMPSDRNEICTVTTFQLKRHTSEKSLIENEKLVLFESGGEYFILDFIPSYSSESQAMENYYSVPGNVAEYIENFRLLV